MQLNLRHIINRDILIYPGYVPETGIQYKVFHYGLKFSVGNWSFDKADWRDTDMVNTCWAKFPEPPDPSMLSHTDENILQRDLLSIECGQALNKALYLHHERRGCRSLYVIANMNPPPSNNLKYKGSDGDVHSSRKLFVPIDVSNSSSIHGPRKEHGSPRIWMIGLWALSVLGFLSVISMPLSRHKEEGARIKGKRLKKSHAGLPEANGRSYC